MRKQQFEKKMSYTKRFYHTLNDITI